MEAVQSTEQQLAQAQALQAQRDLRKQRGLLAQEFLQSELLSQFLLPDIEKKRLGAYPKPDLKGWEEKYRYAFAQDEVYADFMKTLTSWASEAKDIEKQDSEPDKSIV